MVRDQIFKLIEEEKTRQLENIELIASENYVSEDCLKAQGSILTNKYAEGYPNKRYYGGCEVVDKIEQLAIDLACELFEVKYANVQPHSGSSANLAVYRSLLDKGDKVLALSLDQGGHLTHGSKLNFSGIDYNIIPYQLSKDEVLDYEEILRLAKEHRPKMILAGASAYPRAISFKKFREIADEVNAYLMVDMAHIAGLVAAKLHENPCFYADVVTTTTHKTLRGPRSGLILTNSEELITKINKVVFPGIQGGPLLHVIAAKAICFSEALTDEFKDYQRQVLKNAKVFEEEFKKYGYRIVSGGTDNHLLLIDTLNSIGLTGKEAEITLDKVKITVNKNMIPYDTLSPFKTSGIRIGTPAVTTRGFKEKDIRLVTKLIVEALANHDNQEKLLEIKEEVLKLTREFI